MRKTTIYLEEALWERIAEMARDSGRSQADVIRDALRAALMHRRRPRSVGLGRGDVDLAGRADELLADFGER